MHVFGGQKRNNYFQSIKIVTVSLYIRVGTAIWKYHCHLLESNHVNAPKYSQLGSANGPMEPKSEGYSRDFPKIEGHLVKH